MTDTWISANNEILIGILRRISVSANGSLIPITKEEFRVWLGAIRLEPKKEEQKD